MSVKVLVLFSGGKDSLASLIWAKKKYGTKNLEAVFCDTGWEHEKTYQHIKEVIEKLGVKLVVLRSKRFKGMEDLARKTGRFPSTTNRICTAELKVKPMIDYILDECRCHVIVMQGIRAEESAERSSMKAQCRYFRYYFQPYGMDKKGKLKYHTYRAKDVFAFCREFSDDIIRPVFDWTGSQVMRYILDNGLKPNPLYYAGFSRVGCFPCIMCRQGEVARVADYDPRYIERIRRIEHELGITFFPPGYIPARFCKDKSRKERTKNGKTAISERGLPKVDEVIGYVSENHPVEKEEPGHHCMSFYGICE